MRLAVERSNASAVDQDGAVVERAAGTALGEAAHHDRAAARPGPFEEDRIVRIDRRCDRLVGTAVVIATHGEFRQYDDVRPGRGRHGHRGHTRGPVTGEVRGDRRELDAVDADHGTQEIIARG